MWLIYDLIIRIYGVAIMAASLFIEKARLWVQGRKRLFKTIESAVGGQRSAVSSRRSAVGGQQSAVGGQRSAVGGQRSAVVGQQSIETIRKSTIDNRQSAIIWFHCASLGEFEQGRPVIEAFRQEHPEWKIVLTFFSPSGYEIRKTYKGADYIFYLPLDTPWNAKKFIQMVRPSLVVFVKYEFWFRYLDELYKEKIPVYVISAIFRPDQHFFKWYGGWALNQLKKVTGFFVQDVASAELLRANGVEQVVVSGDTRFDRVAAIAENVKPFPLVEKFAGNSPVFLAGSTWPADEVLIMRLIGALGDKIKFIIAPHEVGAEKVALLRSVVSGKRSVVSNQQSEIKALLFSELNNDNAESAYILIIDGIGYLSHLYQYATIAYIGGGFGVGIHNILEAATFGKPVIFGPKYEKFREAVDLIEAGGAFSIYNAQQLNSRTIELLEDKEFLQHCSEICSSFIQRKKGATEIILSTIK